MMPARACRRRRVATEPFTPGRGRSGGSRGVRRRARQRSRPNDERPRPDRTRQAGHGRTLLGFPMASGRRRPSRSGQTLRAAFTRRRGARVLHQWPCVPAAERRPWLRVGRRSCPILVRSLTRIVRFPGSATSIEILEPGSHPRRREVTAARDIRLDGILGWASVRNDA
jgi:hypothetical protein